ncbi:hypothetical protein BDV98DRAFT_507978 [Pterulicium gracile]|uniref:Uncharacterized protein n=1 Tax=Pterulicium gracile TaxID=1884261 RepID=A0A5C3QIM1_9AGAR|nr:hypothetical protein BDV98DRAFT_507978 [Pterula gracilis]
MRAQTTFLVLSGLLSTLVQAHLVPWHPGMYCFGGVQGGDDKNAYNAVTPLYQLDKSQWWMHHVDRCDEFPPAPGKFLELPAGGTFQVEIAANRGKTSWSFGGKFATLWGDGADHPDNYQDSNCIDTCAVHTENYNNVAGSTFAISYTSDIKQVTPENLVVFTVNVHSPWKRHTTFEVPADLPACPPGGCICAWGWVCRISEPNMYQVPYRCNVTGAKSNKVVAQGKPAKWCEDDPSKCVKGAKQMLYWHQLNGNNIEVEGFDLSGRRKSPAYNNKCGFAHGKFFLGGVGVDHD